MHMHTNRNETEKRKLEIVSMPETSDFLEIS
jgi:hypothetical protein